MQARTAASVVGPGGFDLEIWNELSFGSQFLDAEHYYGGPVPGLAKTAPGLQTVAGAASRPVSEAASGEPGVADEEGIGPTDGSEADYGGESEGGAEVEEGPEDSGGEAPAAGAEAGVSAVSSSASTSGVKLVTKEVIKALLSATVGYVRPACRPRPRRRLRPGA